MSALECFSLMCFAHVWRASALLSADLEVLLQHSLVTAIRILRSAPAACSHMLLSADNSTSTLLLSSHLLSFAMMWGARQRKVWACVLFCADLSWGIIMSDCCQGMSGSLTSSPAWCWLPPNTPKRLPAAPCCGLFHAFLASLLSSVWAELPRRNSAST